MKRWIINMLLFSMMLSMTACSDKKAENQISDGITVQENITVKKDNLKKKDTSIGETTVQNEEENEKTEEAEPGDLTEIQKEVSYAEPLQLLITEESMGEWYTDESSEDIINYEKLCDVSWQEVILGEEDAQKYPGLAEALMQINTVNRDYYTNALSDLQLWAQEMLEESEGGDYFYPFYRNVYPHHHNGKRTLCKEEICGILQNSCIFLKTKSGIWGRNPKSLFLTERGFCFMIKSPYFRRDSHGKTELRGLEKGRI